MGLKICSLSSGSKGNCLLIFSENTRILVDAGISPTKVLEGLVKLRIPPQIDALLITHSHFDHVRYLKEIRDAFGVPVYAHMNTVAAMGIKEVNAFDFHDFYVRDITVSPFPLSHDVFCVGYSFYRAGSKVSVLTDTGVVTPDAFSSIEGSEIAVVEANHEPELLQKNPNYSIALKNRILSNRGHLSNEDSAEIAARLVRTGTKAIVLAHLSEENNYPELALDIVRKRLKSENLDCKLYVALQHKMGEEIG